MTSINKLLAIHLRWQFIVALLVVAVLVNYIWELLQSPFYAGMQINARTFGHCFLASLGDGVTVLFIYFLDWLAFRRRDRIGLPARWRLATMLSTGFVVGAIIEWIGVYALHRWSYNDSMPMLPVMRIGLIPVLQMVILPPIIFLMVGNWWISRQSGSTWRR